VDKPARILVIGDAEQAESAIRASQRERCSLACCAADDYLDALSEPQGRRFDWVMIDAGVLRAMGFFSSPPRVEDDGRCGVEWARDGTLQLKCCMYPRSPRLKPVAAGEVQPQSGFVFEYHAPVKRTG
jgi:hypothetical protein